MIQYPKISTAEIDRGGLIGVTYTLHKILKILKMKSRLTKSKKVVVISKEEKEKILKILNRKR